jgi:hypothetical protein
MRAEPAPPAARNSGLKRIEAVCKVAAAAAASVAAECQSKQSAHLCSQKLLNRMQAVCIWNRAAAAKGYSWKYKGLFLEVQFKEFNVNAALPLCCNGRKQQ